MPELITLNQQRLFGLTPEWQAEAQAIQRWLRDRKALLKPVGEVVDHAASPGGAG